MIWKLGQVAGALLMAAGVAMFMLKSGSFASALLWGGVLYAVCRLVPWLRSK
jgi:hypothetical protein